MEPSLEVACSPGVQLTATLCYANNETSASPYAAAATSHVNNGILRGSSSPMVPPSSEPGELDAAAHVSPGVCASAAEHQRETEQLRAQFQKIEADHMKHIEGLQVCGRP